MLPPFIAGGTTNSPQILNEMSGLYRPTASNADLDRLYATGPLVYSMVTYRADNLALVKWQVKDDAGKTTPDSDRLAKLITADLIRRSEISLCFRGYNLIWKRRNAVSQRVIALRWMNFNMYQQDKHWDAGLLGFRIYANSTNYEPVQTHYIPRAEGVYFHFVDLNDDFDGVSPIEAAFMSAGIDVETATTVLAYFQNMAIPALLIQPAADSRDTPSKQDRDDLLSLLRRVAKGVINAGRTVITPTRWDVRELQNKFEDLAMTELTTSARESVSIALRVPLPLVLPTEGNYAQTYEARRGWIQTWLIPQAHWYAQHFTDQFIRPINPSWHVEPDFADVPGQKEDLARRTEVVNAQLTGGYIDLYRAQAALDLTPDEALRDIYMIRGVPVPKAQLSTYWQSASAGGASLGATGSALPPLNLNQSGVPAQPVGAAASAPTAIKTVDTTPIQPDLYLPDDQFKEWRDWRRIVDRKGRDYAFAAKALPADTVTFGLNLLATAFDVDEAFTAIRAHAVVAMKAVKVTNPAYVSLALDDDSATRLQALRPTIAPQVGEVLEWQDPVTYHLTLVYAPNVPDATLQDIIQTLPDAIPLNLQTLSLSSFDNKGDGYPVHLLIDKSPELAAYQRAAQAEFARRGIATSELSDPARWVPHVTLCYAKGPLSAALAAPVLTLGVKAAQVQRDNYHTVHELASGKSAAKSADPAHPTAESPSAPSVNATPADYNHYWKRYNALQAEIKDAWLGDYMKRAGEAIRPRLRPDVSDAEVYRALSDGHADLVKAWIGTIDNPGPLLALALAGMAAGNDALETGTATNPATKALIVSWDLLSQEALRFVQGYAFDLIKGIDQTTVGLVRQAIADGLAAGQSVDQIAEALGGVFDDPARARLIAQSEANRAYNNGALARWQNAGVTRAKWRTATGDACDVCKRLDGQEADIATGWKDPETGKVYRDSAHPGDKCYRSPVL